MEVKSDRELLHFAAKAAGLRVKHEIENMDDECIGLCVKVDGQPKFSWNPLTDDGDALRLAVKLGLSIHRLHDSIGVSQHGNVRGYLAGWHKLAVVESDEAITRRAIVMAAAEIGGAA